MQWFGHFDRKAFLKKRLIELNDGKPATGKVFIDIPAGPGGFSRILKELGFDVRPFDFLPEIFNVEGLKCEYSNMEESIAIGDESADFLICEEGIEHVSDQMKLLAEFNRVLKPGGRLFITTPNISSLRSKLGLFLNEHMYLRRLPLSDLDTVHYCNETQTTYFGHLFLLSPQRMHTMARVNGFGLVRFHANKVNWPSVLLGILWPLLFLSNLEAALSESYRKRKLGFSRAFGVYWGKARINISPAILFSKHTIAEFVKEELPSQRIAKLHQKHATDVNRLIEEAKS